MSCAIVEHAKGDYSDVRTSDDVQADVLELRSGVKGVMAGWEITWRVGGCSCDAASWYLKK